ncbi:MAG: DUF1415 domain-containing protein [Pseudomonadota bacterium]
MKRPAPVPPPPVDARRVIAHTRAWVERAVVGLNLCPFAKAPLVKGQLRFVVFEGDDPRALLDALCEEMKALVQADPGAVETTLLIHPNVLQDFDAFNDFLDAADAVLEELGLDGVLQVASFHPQYRFADTAADDPGNATNRAPYPTLHLLREASVERAVAAFPAAEAIYEANIATLEALGAEGWARLQAQCRADADADAKR